MQTGAQRKLVAKVQVLNGKFAGREVELNKALTTLGSPGAQVIAITKRTEGYFIVLVENKKPDNPPSVNGSPLGSQAVKLGDNDVCRIEGLPVIDWLIDRVVLKKKLLTKRLRWIAAGVDHFGGQVKILADLFDICDPQRLHERTVSQRYRRFIRRDQMPATGVDFDFF